MCVCTCTTVQGPMADHKYGKFVIRASSTKRTFSFPKREFGTKKEKRYFRAECKKYIPMVAPWCWTWHSHMPPLYEGWSWREVLASTKQDAAFLDKFVYWKEATTGFHKNQSSQCHCMGGKQSSDAPTQTDLWWCWWATESRASRDEGDQVKVPQTSFLAHHI